MKDKYHRLRQQLNKLRRMQNDGKKDVEWKLTIEQLDFFSKYFYVEESLYTIRTKQFMGIRNKDPLIKEIHFASKKRKKTIVKGLTQKQKKVLDDAGVSYKPCKYRIVLNK